MFFRSFLVLSLASLTLFAEEQSELANRSSKVSEAFGHLIGKNLDSMGVEFDVELVAKGLRDAVNGKAAPMSETECIEAIGAAQEEAYKAQAEANLAKAETFLKSNAKNKGVTSLEEGKIQYKVDKKGKGEKVAASSSPVIRYVGKYLDGSVFGQSKDAETLSLEESIPGFSKGLVGMKEGEKRTLYIHPEFGYGTQGFLPPNSLLTFEIEIVKANTQQEELTDSLIIESEQETAPAPELDSSVVR